MAKKWLLAHVLSSSKISDGLHIVPYPSCNDIRTNTPRASQATRQRHSGGAERVASARMAWLLQASVAVRQPLIQMPGSQQTLTLARPHGTKSHVCVDMDVPTSARASCAAVQRVPPGKRRRWQCEAKCLIQNQIAQTHMTRRLYACCKIRCMREQQQVLHVQDLKRLCCILVVTRV